MPDNHLDLETLDRAVRGEIESRELIRSILQHLWAVCPVCRRAWQARRRLRAATAGRAGYRAVFDQALETVRDRHRDLEPELETAPELAQLLVEAPAGTRWQLLRQSRFYTWGLCNTLIEASRRAAFEDPTSAAGLARMALHLAEGLDPRVYGERFLADVRAMAWAYLGNALRVHSDLREAGEALAAAAEQLAKGTGDPLTEAQVLGLEASLRREQRRFEASQALLDRVVEIYAAAGETHLEGRALIKKAYCLHEAGQPAAAATVLERAMTLVDPRREPRLPLCARHNLICCLHDDGRHAEAERLLARSRPLYERFSDVSTRLRWHWIRGKLARVGGREEEAETELRLTRSGFIAQGIGYDAALASLDLAILFIDQDRPDEVKKLAQQMLPIFRARDVHREAMAALLVFQQAALAETMTAELVREIATYLERAKRHPGLRYEPSQQTSPEAP